MNSKMNETKTIYAKNQDRNRITEMEITWRVNSGKEAGGKWGKRYRE